MELNAKSVDRKLLVELSGDLDHHGAREAIRQLELAIDAALPRQLVLDMAGVGFMDSSGIALIMRAQQRVQRVQSGPAGSGCGRYRPPRDYTMRQEGYIS